MLPIRKSVTRNEAPKAGGMIIRSILKCAIVLTLTHCHIAQCDSDTRHNRTPTRRSWTSSSISNRGRKITSGENVTRSDNDGSFDKRRFDNREFPSSARHRQLDTSYLDYDESGISTASATELPNCILSRSEFYLSWWVDENGQLKLPASNRDGKSPGFADLSLKFHNQDAMFKHISDMTSENPNDVNSLISFICHWLNSRLTSGHNIHEHRQQRLGHAALRHIKQGQLFPPISVARQQQLQLAVRRSQQNFS